MSLPETGWQRVDSLNDDPIMTETRVESVILQKLRWQWWPAWVMILVPIPLYVMYGTPDDWLRHGVYVMLALVAWATWHEQADLAVMTFLIGLIPLVNWHFLDTTSALNTLSLGLVGFGLIAGISVYGLAAYFGRRFTLLGLIVTGICLGSQAGRANFVQYPVALVSLLSMAAIGIHQRRMLDRLERISVAFEQSNTVDILTGFENGRALSISFGRYAAIARRREVPLLISAWDLNDLRGTNNRQGRLAGDERLKLFSKSLYANARADDAVFRIGDDKFIGLHLGLEDGSVLASRVLGVSANVAGGWTLVGENNLEDALSKATTMMRQNKAGVPLPMPPTPFTTELN